MPIFSLSVALCVFRMACRALLKTVHGVPMCTTLIQPAFNQLRIASCVERRLRSWCDPKEMSTGGAVAIPHVWTAAVKRLVPEKISKKNPGTCFFGLGAEDDWLGVRPASKLCLSTSTPCAAGLWKTAPRFPELRPDFCQNRESRSAGLRLVSKWRSLHLTPEPYWYAAACLHKRFRGKELDLPRSKAHRHAKLSVSVSLVLWCKAWTLHVRLSDESATCPSLTLIC